MSTSICSAGNGVVCSPVQNSFFEQQLAISFILLNIPYPHRILLILLFCTPLKASFALCKQWLKKRFVDLFLLNCIFLLIRLLTPLPILIQTPPFSRPTFKTHRPRLPSDYCTTLSWILFSIHWHSFLAAFLCPIFIPCTKLHHPEWCHQLVSALPYSTTHFLHFWNFPACFWRVSVTLVLFAYSWCFYQFGMCPCLFHISMLRTFPCSYTFHIRSACRPFHYVLWPHPRSTCALTSSHSFSNVFLSFRSSFQFHGLSMASAPAVPVVTSSGRFAPAAIGDTVLSVKGVRYRVQK